MNGSSWLQDNAKIFLPILGLVVVLVALAFVRSTDLDFTPYTGLGTDKPKTYSEAPEMKLEAGIDYKAVVKTNFGDFTINLFESITPKNVNNFVFLSEEGFYKNSDFHRIVTNFVIQTGDSLGDGTGNPGYYIEDEVRGALEFSEYTVAMAKGDEPNTNGSQFFVTLRGGNFSHLNDNSTIIGEVVEGMDVVEKIGALKTDENDKPIKKAFVREILIVKESK